MEDHCLKTFHPIDHFKQLTSILLIVIALCYTHIACAQLIATSEIDQLDKDFTHLSVEIYQYISHPRQMNDKSIDSPIDSIETLTSKVHAYLNQSDHVSAISLLIKNFQLVKDNIDDASIFKFISLLLEHNHFISATELYELIKSEGDKSLESNVAYHFARYYLDRHQWQKTIDLLADTYTELPVKESHFAYLMTGLSYQRLKQHRVALKYYKNIPDSSDYYYHAQINTAVAYIKQGWWTDARTTINALLDNKKIHQNEDMINRSYLLLGYALLSREYYRDAREAFRNIHLDSQYTNRALLGIALTSANQQDYLSAHNALSRLRNNNSLDLSVDESYLILPYVYEKLKQSMTASASYSEAIDYYQTRISELEKSLGNHKQVEKLKVNVDTSKLELIINETTLDYRSRYPAVFIKNLAELKTLSRAMKNSSHSVLQSKLERLIRRYNAMLSRIAASLLAIRQNYLRSYLNQARYGLARLYDNSLTSNP